MTTASALLLAYRQRELSPVEHVRALSAQIERHERRVRAFVVLDLERAHAAAQEAEQRYARGEARALEGVPFVVKDLLPVRGLATRRGSLITPTAHANADAPAVARLRERGAILLGKTTTSEFGLRGASESPLSGITHNPWNLAHSPGGSSAGSVAAVAAGFAPIALGTDGGGSIRVPSSYAGVVGLKPSFGRVAAHVPTLVGAPPHVGPIARSIEDIVLALHALAVPDVRDPWSLGHREFAGAGPVAGLRIAYSAHLGHGSLDPDVESAFRQAILAFRELGVELTEADPDFPRAAPALDTLFAVRAAETVSSLSPEQRELLDPAIEQLARSGEELSARAVWGAEAARLALLERSAVFHQRFDLLLTPTVNRTAPPLAGEPPGRVSFAGPFSLTRQPALSVPCGLDRHGLPIGLQIVGRHFEEERVLGAALAFARVAPFRERPTLGARLGGGE
jgi:aspartyl-tRNA(Asn)/glutamyl-tRNA(Gln) amidotransferase subunit A